MTVVIGYVNKKSKEVIMGADRCVSNSLEKNTFACSKIYQPAENPNFLIGIAGDPRVHQLVKGFLCFPTEEQLQAEKVVVNDQFIIRAIIPQINTIMLDHHYADPDFREGSSLMIAYKDKVWKIGPGYQLISYDTDFLVMGSGQFVARGVLGALEDYDVRPIDKVIKALTLSTKMAIGVDGPYDIYVTGKGKLDSEQLEEMLASNSIPTLIETQNFNYIKKVVKQKVSLIDAIYSNDGVVYLTKEDGSNVYFVDLNGVLGVLKTNGDVIYNSNDIDDIELNIWNIVEINQKAKSLLDTVSMFKFELDPEEIEEANNETIEEIDALIDKLLKEKQAITGVKEKLVEDKPKASAKKKPTNKKKSKKEVVEDKKDEEIKEKEIEEKPVQKKKKTRKASSKKANEVKDEEVKEVVIEE